MTEKTTSLARIEANRKNALKSTGPKTPEGKTAVKWNALKHGLLSREVLIQAGDGKESKTEFINLHTQLRDDLQPEGILEEMQVERIAVCYWRLRRALRSEIGEIRKELDNADWRDVLKKEDQFRADIKYLASPGSRESLQKSSLGLEYLIDILEQTTRNIEETGYLSNRAEEVLTEYFGVDENSFVPSLLALNKSATKGPTEGKQDPPQKGATLIPDQCKENILALIGEEKKALQDLKESIDQNDELERQAMLARLTLPSKEVVDKILRYETTIERQLYRAMGQLERLQRRRKGEPTIPPITIDVMKEE